MLVFNPKIESITVTDGREDDKNIYGFKIESQTELAPDIDMYKIYNGKTESYDYLIVAKDNHNLQLCVAVDENNTLVEKLPKDSILYADFPLIGSHEFPFPCFINSHIFWPDEERSSIILSYSSYAELNRRLLYRTTILYRKLMSYLITDRKYKGITKLSLLSGQIPKDIQQEKDWYIKNVLNKNISSVCSLNLVKTESGERR